MFKNREDAGYFLAGKIKEINCPENSVLLAVPRGGVVVGKVVSDLLRIPLYPLIIKKIGSPQNPELALGAVGSNNTTYWEKDIVKHLHISKNLRDRLKETKLQEVQKREKYLQIQLPDLKDKTVIVIDDGVATGATVKAGAKLLKKLKVKELILATPVITKETTQALKGFYREILFLVQPDGFRAIGEFYDEFGEVDDKQVKDILLSTSNIDKK